MDGKRYRVHWMSGAEEHTQSFDGSLWYLYAQSEAMRSGSVISRPEATLGVDLEEQLSLTAGGSFYPRWIDVVDRPFNLGEGPPLVDRLAALEGDLSGSLEGERALLQLRGQVASDKYLPSEVKFEILGQEFYPAEIVLEVPTPKGVRVARTSLMSYREVGTAYYPSLIEVEVVERAKGMAPKTLLHAKLTLSIKPVPPPHAKAFQIAFPSGTRVNDDRTAKPAEGQPQGSRSPWLPLLAVGLLAIGAVALALLRRRR